MPVRRVEERARGVLDRLKVGRRRSDQRCRGEEMDATARDGDGGEDEGG